MISALSVQAADLDLSDYPAPFVSNGIFDATIVVGRNAATSDVIGAVDIAASLVAESDTDIRLGRIDSLFGSNLAVLDVDAPALESENLIVVGGPCINSVAAELLDYPMPCHSDFELGKAKVMFFPEKKAILVAGYEAQETLAASYVLADYRDYDLDGTEMEIVIAGQGLLTLNPKD